MKNTSKMGSMLAMAVAIIAVFHSSAYAKPLTQDEVVKTMVDRKITTRSFGLTVTLRFQSNGVLTAKSLVADYKGVWRRGKGNTICSTFDSGPAKGTQCNSYTKTGKNTYRTSSGTRFRVH